MPPLTKTCTALQVRLALESKIARERVGVELAGMMTGPDPVLAAHHLANLNIFPSVFQPPPNLRESLGSSLSTVGVELLEAGRTLLQAASLQVPFSAPSCVDWTPSRSAACRESPSWGVLMCIVHADQGRRCAWRA